MTTGATKPAPVVIGVGNPDRGDDAAGREVARRLRSVCDGGCDIVELQGEATAVLARLEGAEAVWLIDASVSGAPPGTIRRFDASAARLPRSAFGLSSHGFGAAEALKLATTLGALPKICVVYAIEGRNFDVGAPMSSEVARAVDEVVDKVRREAESLIDNGATPMHEARLISDLMRRVLEIAKAEQARRVTKVTVWLGALSHMSSSHFAEHFIEASRGTIAEGAELDAQQSTDIRDPNAQSVLIRSVDVET